MHPRVRSGLTVFAYFTAVGLGLFGYRYFERIASRETVSPLEPLINEVLTGAWTAAILFPLIARFARRFPFERSTWTTRIPLHLAALGVFSLAHTSMMWASRSILYPLFGLGRFDYGVMVARYPMEFFHDVIAYTVIVSILYLFDRHVRAIQLEGKLAHSRLENLRLQLRSRQNPGTRSLFVVLYLVSRVHASESDWTAYGHDAGGTRYSPLKQITRENVANLKPAWIYHTGALQPVTPRNQKAAFESTPILVEGTLYLTTPFNQVIALDPGTGAEKWKFDPQVDRSHDYSEVTSRGVAAWVDNRTSGSCRLRIFEGTIDARLIALDGNTGKPCANFGKGGEVELWHGVMYGPEFTGDYEVTSAPTVVGDLVITGSAIADNMAVDMPRGVVRAYDARTGALRWTWDPIPWADKQLVRTGAANAWSTFAADAGRDLVFIPTGSASPDYYGGARPGDNKWADSVVALKASTGAFVWGFQVVHHDLWDYDVASQPVLIDYGGKAAVAVTTKVGNLFVLDRETGKPLHAVEERAVPKSDVGGEGASPSQPIPEWSPMVPQTLAVADGWCREKLATLRNDGLFTPPSYKGSVAFPGNVGGVNWGSAAWDPIRKILLANTNRVAAVMKLIPREDLGAALAHPDEMAWGGEFARQRGTPYGLHRDWLVSPDGQTCNPAPAGALVAFDLSSGKLRWQAPLSSVTLGGPIVTAGGVIFTAAAMDPNLSAFDADTGRKLWAGALPASAQATPMTYQWRGKQYVVICAGGHGKMKSRMGDAVVAFVSE